MAPFFQKIRAPSGADASQMPELLNRVQDAVARTVNPLATMPLLNGVLLQGVVLTSTAITRVNHTLGRPLLGWILTRVPALFTAIYEDQAGNATPELTLNLYCDVDTTVDLWVF